MCFVLNDSFILHMMRCKIENKNDTLHVILFIKGEKGMATNETISQNTLNEEKFPFILPPVSSIKYFQ